MIAAERVVGPEPSPAFDLLVNHKAHVKLVKDMLEDRADGIVDDRLELRDASYFDNKRILAYSNITKEGAAIIVSSGAERTDGPAFLPIVVVPKREGSGILVSRSTNTVWTDSFWICEDGRLVRVETTSPIQIDQLDTTFDYSLNDLVVLVHTRNRRFLYQTARDKIYTREILANAGIPIPRGIALKKSTDINAAIDGFVAENPDMEGLVLKQNLVDSGQGVKLFRMDQVNKIKNLVASGFLLEDHGYVLEERIIPPYSGSLVQALNMNARSVDYNFRLLTTIHPGNSLPIDGEVRFRPPSYKPVNVSIDAKADRLGNHFQPFMVERISRVACAATEAIAQEGLEGAEPFAGFAGVDAMIDKFGRIVVLEAALGNAGGFATLFGMDRKPLWSVANVMMPEFAKIAEASFAKRPKEKPSDLRRLDHNLSDEDTLKLIAELEDQYRGHREFNLQYKDSDREIDNAFYLARKVDQKDLDRNKAPRRQQAVPGFQRV